MEGDTGNSNGVLPPGFRFHPTDEELLTCYLVGKISNPNTSGLAVLMDVDLNRCEPWDLPGNAKIGEKEWYFYGHRDRKYPTGLRTNRATKTGHWKTTGKDKEIYSTTTAELIGMKKTLVFYRGRAPRGEKTGWIMHEFRLHTTKRAFPSIKEEWVICRVFQKGSPAKKYHPGYSLETRPVLENFGSPIFGSYTCNGPTRDMDKITQTVPSSSHAASSVYGGSPMGYTPEPYISDDAVDLLAYWSSFLLN